MKLNKNLRKKHQNIKSRQAGVALAIGIILLLIISVIGVNSMKSALLQEKMSGGLSRSSFAETAAYSLLVSVENYVYSLYEGNTGTNSETCDYCTSDQPRGDQWHGFTREKNMSEGEIFSGASHLGPLLPYLHDTPRYVLIKLPNIGSANGIVGEFDDGSSGGNAGQAGNSGSSELQFDYFRIAAKANDFNGNTYVVYESTFAAVEN